MIELEKLVERIEALTGPSREVDALIWCALFAPPEAYVKESPFNSEWLTYHLNFRGKEALVEPRGLGAPRQGQPFTASLDCAMTLVPEGLGWGLTNIEGGDYEAMDFSRCTAVLHGGSVELCRSDAATPALALCAAALRARAADAPNDPRTETSNGR